MGKVCTKPILRLLWKMVENMLFLDSEHVEMGVVGGGGERGVGNAHSKIYHFF